MIDTSYVPIDGGLMVEHWADQRDQLLIVPPMSWQARQYIYAPAAYRKRVREEANPPKEIRLGLRPAPSFPRIPRSTSPTLPPTPPLPSGAL